MPRQSDSFDELLMRLEPECSNAREAHRRCRNKLIKFFQWRSCEDSEGLADDTIARFFQRYSSGTEIRSDNPYAYVYAIALNVFREFLRQKQKTDRIRSNWTPPLFVTDKNLDCKKECFAKLSSDKRELLERYYGSNEDPEIIAQAQGITIGALRLRIHRIKEELRPCYLNCRKS